MLTAGHGSGATENAYRTRLFRRLREDVDDQSHSGGNGHRCSHPAQGSQDEEGDLAGDEPCTEREKAEDRDPSDEHEFCSKVLAVMTATNIDAKIRGLLGLYTSLIRPLYGMCPGQ